MILPVTWLHISDLHISVADNYDRHVVLKALLRSFDLLLDRAISPDLIFVTGDIAFSGRSEEYDAATKFFDGNEGHAQFSLGYSH